MRGALFALSEFLFFGYSFLLRLLTLKITKLRSSGGIFYFSRKLLAIGIFEYIFEYSKGIFELFSE